MDYSAHLLSYVMHHKPSTPANSERKKGKCLSLCLPVRGKVRVLSFHNRRLSYSKSISRHICNETEKDLRKTIAHQTARLHSHTSNSVPCATYFERRLCIWFEPSPHLAQSRNNKHHVSSSWLAYLKRRSLSQMPYPGNIIRIVIRPAVIEAALITTT